MKIVSIYLRFSFYKYRLTSFHPTSESYFPVIIKNVIGMKCIM